MRQWIRLYALSLILTLLPFGFGAGFAYLAHKAMDNTTGTLSWTSEQLRVSLFNQSWEISLEPYEKHQKTLSPFTTILFSRNARTVYLLAESLWHALPQVVSAYDEFLFQKELSQSSVSPTSP